MPVPVPQQRSVPAAETSHGDLTLLVIEDDPAGTTITVPELSAAAGTQVRIRTARNLTEAARLLTDDVDCILLDLALPLTGGGAAPARPPSTPGRPAPARPTADPCPSPSPSGPASWRPSPTYSASRRSTRSSR